MMANYKRGNSSVRAKARAEKKESSRHGFRCLEARLRASKSDALNQKKEMGLRAPSLSFYFLYDL